MKNRWLLFSLIALLMGCGQNPPPPNIIFILADDQRFDALGCAGHPVIETPNIDRLAAKGIRFSKAFVTTPICAASRATLLTGLMERTHGYTFGKEDLSREEAINSYPALLKNAGYRTGFFGKFGVRMDTVPEVLFDEYTFRGQPYITEDGHIDELNTADAISFLSEQTDSLPFCLSISFSSAHAEDGDHVPGENNHFAVIGPMKGKYEQAAILQPRLGDTSIFHNLPDFLKNSLNRERYFWRWDTPEKYEQNMKAYYGMISGIDFMVGLILTTLENEGLDKNTIVIYMSDNGYYMGERGFAGKWSHYDESLHVPLIIYDPRKRPGPSQKTIDKLVLNLDIPPTILDYAGVEIPEKYQGKSLAPFFEKARPSDWRKSFFCEHLMDHPKIPKWEGVRDSRYIYANYFDVDPPYTFLHDLMEDPDQLQNVAAHPGYQEILHRLQNDSRQFRLKYAEK